MRRYTLQVANDGRVIFTDIDEADEINPSTARSTSAANYVSNTDLNIISLTYIGRVTTVIFDVEGTAVCSQVKLHDDDAFDLNVAICYCLGKLVANEILSPLPDLPEWAVRK